MKKILVTGATGFLGNYVIEELLKKGNEVIASSANIEKAERHNWYKSVTYIPLDFSVIDPSADYYRFFLQPDLLIHLAWEGLPNYKSSFHIDTNLPRQIQFLKNIVDNGLNDITVTGTCFEYGMQEGCLTEAMPSLPANAYAIAKNELRKFIEEYTAETSLSFKWLRLFYMFGKGQNPNSLLSQLDKTIADGKLAFDMSGGEQIRDFLPVEKMAEYIVKVSLQKRITGIINCCSNKPISVKKFVENYLEKEGKSIALNLGYYPYPDYEPMYFWGDNTKLNKITNNE